MRGEDLRGCSVSWSVGSRNRNHDPPDPRDPITLPHDHLLYIIAITGVTVVGTTSPLAPASSFNHQSNGTFHYSY
jgi:hypothetical protein